MGNFTEQFFGLYRVLGEKWKKQGFKCPKWWEFPFSGIKIKIGFGVFLVKFFFGEISFGFTQKKNCDIKIGFSKGKNWEKKFNTSLFSRVY
ncbi:MAG: hypothetical protein CM15mV76_260 [uncultured marine virus]|nr:MAG: hypothetical protein CM15mV76_260 [uncultured marine virus]